MSDDFRGRGGSPWGSPPGGGNNNGGNNTGYTKNGNDITINLNHSNFSNLHSNGWFFELYID